MRIALYHGLPAGGAKHTLFEQARRLSAHHTIDLYTLGATDDRVYDVRPFARTTSAVPFTPGRLFHSPIGRLNQAVRSGDLWRLRSAAILIAREIEAAGYDVVLVHPCQYTSVPWLLQFLRLPAVYFCQEHNRSIHDPWTDRPYLPERRLARALDHIDPLLTSYRYWLKQIEMRGLRAAARVLVNSRYIRDVVKSISHVAAHVCYHGVDAVTFHPLQCPRENFVLSVGYVAPQKGFDLIIDGLAKLPGCSRPRLVIVGHHGLVAEVDYLQALADRQQVTITFLEGVSDDELVRLYNKALLTIYTPYLEPFGLVPLESMACGTPVVGIAEGGVQETIIDRVTGRLVSRDPDVVAQAMGEIIASPDLRADMGKAARSYVEERWSWDHSISELEQHLLAASGPGRAASGSQQQRTG